MSVSGIADLSRRLGNARRATLEDIAFELKFGFGMWTETWDHLAPIVIEYKENSAMVSINDPIASLINFGTDARYEIPSGPYELKTYPYELQSVPGGGAPWKATSERQLGIEARRADVVNAQRAEAVAPLLALLDYLEEFPA